MDYDQTLANLTAPESIQQPYADIYGTHPENLLARPQVHCEIINDINGDIVRAYRRWRNNETETQPETSWAPTNWQSRLMATQIDCTAPPKLLELMTRQPEATILVAPPTHPDPYPANEIAEITQLLTQAQPTTRIVVKGPPHDWQHLTQLGYKHTAAQTGTDRIYQNQPPPNGPPIKPYNLKPADPARLKTALPWLGGKTLYNPGGTGRWLEKIIPTDAATYCEPYAGMLGQLLTRQPAATEIATDTNPRLINWWTIVRDRPDELAALIAATPNARAEWAAAQNKLDDPDPLTRAWAFQTAVVQGIATSDSSINWLMYSRGQTSKVVRQHAKLNWLAHRVAKVEFKCQPAAATLTQLADAGPSAVIYCDPPYPSRRAMNREYGDHGQMLADELAATTEALQAQTARVIVSGVEGEWDHLGWHRLERPTQGHSLAHLNLGDRIECAWTNWPPPQLD